MSIMHVILSQNEAEASIFQLCFSEYKTQANFETAVYIYLHAIRVTVF
jgi:hypothetical protein